MIKIKVDKLILNVFYYFLIITLIISCSYKQYNYGKIVSDSTFSFNKDDFSREKDCGLAEICDSKNNIEIRLQANYFPTSLFSLYVLTNNHDSHWTLTRYDNIDTNYIINSYKIISKRAIEALFETSIKNNIFSLPNQSELKLQNVVDDGNWYTLSFKIGWKFRRYEFNNPDNYARNYGNVQELKNYSNIAKAFYDLFDKK